MIDPIINKNNLFFQSYDGRDCWTCVADANDIYLAMSRRWIVTSKGLRSEVGTTLFHRAKMGVNDTDTVILHINGDKIDNRRDNLLVLSKSEANKSYDRPFRLIDKKGAAIGISRNVIKTNGSEYSVWSACCGRNKRKSFSVKKHGERGAATKAIKFRLNSLDEMDATVLHNYGFPEEWGDMLEERFYSF